MFSGGLNECVGWRREGGGEAHAGTYRHRQQERIRANVDGYGGLKGNRGYQYRRGRVADKHGQ